MANKVTIFEIGDTIIKVTVIPNLVPANVGRYINVFVPERINEAGALTSQAKNIEVFLGTGDLKKLLDALK